ncbi:MAG: protein kinase domain-containing protein [Planctomycetota bacterium]
MTELQEIIGERYRLKRELGAGGMGNVVLAEDASGESPNGVALKWVQAPEARSAKRERHRTEFELLSSFAHPHILRAFEFETRPHHGIQFYSCEYLRGPALSQLLGEAEPDWTHAVLRHLLLSLCFLHDQGWVHGDIKPQNILLRQPLFQAAPQACLIDFGLCRREHSESDHNIVGTVHYISPERLRGEPLDRRSDLYSVGVLAYQILTQKLPFSGRRKVDIIESQLRQAPAPLRTHNPHIEADLEALVLRLLAKRPQDRPADAQEVLQSLQACWPATVLRDSIATASAYVESPDRSGWEHCLSLTIGKCLQRAGCADSTPGVAAEQEAEVLPLRPTACGAPGRGFLAIRCAGPSDRRLLANTVRRRISLAGVNAYVVDGEGCREWLTKLTRKATENQRNEVRALAFADGHRAGANAPDSGGDLTENPGTVLDALIGALQVSGELPPFVVIVLPSTANLEPLAELLSLARDAERRHEGMRRVTWISFLGPNDELPVSADKLGWAQELVVPPLDLESRLRWTYARFGARPPMELHLALQEVATGFPSQLATFLDRQLKAGLLKRTLEGWVYAPPRLAQLPGETRVHAERFELLARPDQLFLVGIALNDKATSQSELAALTQLSTEELKSTETRLVENGWIQRADDGCRFALPAQLPAVVAACAPEMWQVGNLRAAREILASSCSVRDEQADRLVAHFLAARQPQIAIPFACDGAQRAIEHGAQGRGIQLLTQLLESEGATSISDQVRIGDYLGDLLQTYGPVRPAVDWRRRVLQLATSAGSSQSILALLVRKLGHSEALCGSFSDALETLSALTHARAPSTHPTEQRRVMLLQAEVLLVLGRPLEAFSMRDALGPIDQAIPCELAGWEYDVLATWAECCGQLDKAKDFLCEGLCRLESFWGDRAAAWSAHLLGRSFELDGIAPVAISLYRLAAQRFCAEEQHRLQTRSILYSARALLAIGSRSEGRSQLLRAERLVEQIGGILERRQLDNIHADLTEPAKIRVELR